MINIFELLHISEEKKKFLIIGILSAVLLFLDIFFVIRPLFHKSSDLKMRIVAVEKNIDDVTQNISTLPKTEKKLEDLKSEQALYEKSFPKEEEVPSLLESLSRVAASSSVDIIAIKPIKIEPNYIEKNPKPFHEIPIELQAKGGYHQIGQFINKLERLDRFMEVKDLKISQDNTTPRRHYLKLLLSTYILRMR